MNEDNAPEETADKFNKALQAQIACATGKSNAALDILASPTSHSFGLESATSADNTSYAGDDEETEDVTAVSLAAATQKTLASIQQQKQQEEGVMQDSTEDSVFVEAVQSDPSATVNFVSGNKLNKEEEKKEEPVATEDHVTTAGVVDFARVQLKHLASKSGEDDDSANTGPVPVTNSAISPPRSKSQPPPAQKRGDEEHTRLEHTFSQPTFGTSTVGTVERSECADTTDALYQVMSEGAGTASKSKNLSTGGVTINKTLFSNFRKFAAEGNAQEMPQPPLSTNPLVASLQKSMSFNKNEKKSPERSNLKTNPSHRQQALQGKYLQQQIALQPSSTTEQDVTQFDFVNMDVHGAESGDINVVYANVDRVVSEASSTGAGSYSPPEATNPTRYTMSRAPDTTSNNKVTFSDAEDIDSPGRQNQRPLQSFPTSDEEDLTNTQYESDDSDLWGRRTGKQQRPIRSRSNSGILETMTLMQTMKHNTRANFCAVFLLGVALATLILLVVAKLTGRHEQLYYDEENDTNVVISSNEKLLTLYLLSFSLMIVLLAGSVIYCGVACCDSSSQDLVNQVKHEDACLANASGRRRHPNDRPAVSNKWYSRSSNTKGSIVLTPPGCDDHSHSHNSDAQSQTNDQQYLQNQTFSMMSSATEQSQDRIDMETGAVVLSMDDENAAYYEELEKQSGCCSPLAMTSTDKDEDDIESMKRGMLV